VMKERSMILEDAERKAIELSRQWDGNFPEWQPNYNKMFDVSDPEKDMKTIVLTQQMELPPTMQKIQQRKTLEVLERIGNGEIPEEERLQALEEIAAFQPQTFELLPEPTEE